MDETKVERLDSSKSASPSGDAVAEIYVDPIIERRALRKFDIWVVPQMMLLVILAYLDRSNIGNARVFGFEEGLGLKGIEFNNLSTLFFVTYVVFEIPWVMAIKKFGANKVLATAMVCWSVVTLGTGFVQNYHQCLALRLLLGVFEAGLFPCLSFLISMIYSRESQAKRVAALYGAIALSGAFGGLIAYGIQLMGDRHGLEAWRWLFIVEGIISIVLGCICLLSLPKSAENAWFLNEEEKAVMRARKERDAIYKGEEKFEWKYVKMAFLDPFIYVAGAGLFLASIPLFGFNTFLPTIIRGLGYDALQANYLTIPVYFAGTISLFCASWVSDKINKRAIIAGTVPILVLIGYAIVVATPSIGAGFFAMFLLSLGIYPYNTILLAWVSGNIKPDHKRAVGLPLFISIANASGLVSSQIYPASDGPRYIKGNAISLAGEALAIASVWLIFLILRRRNIKKDQLIAQGVTDNGKEGDQALDFKYTL
ncbi:hypothetical protein AJ80_07599 [Polytolypa hystricis UAMH7299]|uniref:Major facilitator superfamily (MFS) profile domain-containing protein n=1 Tax=Polytolypa hystricis (strain UAMH7299) TaxID=1447883 RepID=A0A2B7XLR4_POLH7|nr:hypothetical protein AJ80_07599 [Polytolypa hystricis UAMH7299]